MICAVNPAYPHFKGLASAGDGDDEDGDDDDDQDGCVGDDYDDEDHKGCVDIDDDHGYDDDHDITSRRVAVEPSDYERNLRKTLKILSKLPKTLVILLAPIQVK